MTTSNERGAGAEMYRFLCGPTVGCGKTFEIPRDGQQMVCPHCGHQWGRAPVMGIQVMSFAIGGRDGEQ